MERIEKPGLPKILSPEEVREILEELMEKMTGLLKEEEERKRGSESGVFRPPRLEDWIITVLMECEWVTIHSSSKSEVKVEVLRGEAGLKVNGEDLGKIRGLMYASGIVQVHGLKDNTTICYSVVKLSRGIPVYNR